MKNNKWNLADCGPFLEIPNNDELVVVHRPYDGIKFK
jgi:hypothetical protein